MDSDRTLQAILRAIGEIARAGSSAESCAAALDAATAALDVPRGWIQCFDAGGVPRIVHSRGVSPACRAAAELGLPWAPAPGATPSRGIVVVGAGAGGPGKLPGALRADGLGAAVFVPVFAGDRLLGALALPTETQREWTAAERSVLDGIAQLIADAFERDRERSLRQGLEQALLQGQRLVSVGRLAGAVAHDFNNMLTAMIGYMDLVSSGLPPDAEEQAYVAQALEAAELATALSRQMLAFARREPTPPTPQDLNALLCQFAPLLHRLLPGNLRFAVATRADPAWVLADAGQVEQVIVNLALRARDAMPEGGALELSTIHVAAADGGPPFAGIEAVNTGESLAAEALRRALDPSGFAGMESRGSELSIAAALVRASGGRLEAGIAAAGGTLVRALWPATDAPGA